MISRDAFVLGGGPRLGKLFPRGTYVLGDLATRRREFCWTKKGVQLWVVFSFGWLQCRVGVDGVELANLGPGVFHIVWNLTGPSWRLLVPVFAKGRKMVDRENRSIKASCLIDSFSRFATGGGASRVTFILAPTWDP